MDQAQVAYRAQLERYLNGVRVGDLFSCGRPDLDLHDAIIAGPLTFLAKMAIALMVLAQANVL